MQVQAALSCILLACIAASLATDTDAGPERPKRDLALLKSIVSKLLPTLPLPIRDEVVTFPATFGERVVNLRKPILDDPDCNRPKFTRLRQPYSMVRLPPPPPFLLPVNPSPMEFVPRSMQIYPPPPPLPVPPPVRVLPPPVPVLPSPGCTLPHPHPMPIPPPPKTIVPLPPKPILPLRKTILPSPPMPILPPPKTILPPPPLPVMPLPLPSFPVFPLPLPPIVTEPILPPMPIELPKPILIPSFKYLYNQRNEDGSVSTTYSKDGKDVLVTITDDKLRIPAGVIVDRVEKIVTGAPFLPIISGPEPVIPVPIRDFPVPMRPSFHQAMIAPRPLDLGGQWMPPAIEITNKSFISGVSPHYGGPRLPNLIENGDREDSVSVTTRKISRVPPPPFYSYKQINSEMSEPVAVVNVEHPVPFGPGLPFPGDAETILNRHEHIRPDGTRYTCFEKHLPVRVNPVEPMTEFSGPNGFPHMQPMPPLEVHATQMMNRGSLKFDTSFSDPQKTEESFKMLPLLPLPEKLSLSKNPVVVLPHDENTFSYNVSKMDGSSLDVKADKNNKVSVRINNGKRRGDIPE